MKETQNSLHWYFLVLGVVYIYLAVNGFMGLNNLGQSSATVILGIVVSACIGLAAFYFAAKLPDYLTAKKVKYLKTFIVILVLGSFLEQFTETSAFDPVYSIPFALLFGWYLFYNIDRIVYKK